MAKGEDSHSEMASVPRSDGIDVIFDRTSPASSRSRSRSKSSDGSSRSSGSRRHRGRSSHRSRSSSRTRSRSHPRCYRPSSRCRCDNHRRYGRSRRSPPRRYRAHSRSYSRSPVRRSHHRSSSRSSRYRRTVSRISQSPSRTRSRSGSSAHSVNSTLNDKREVIEANATTIQGEETLEIPERLNPVLSEQPEPKQLSPQTWVRLDPQEPPSQSSEEDPDDTFSQKVFPTRKTISFSFNASLVKAAVAVPSSAKVTSRVDSYESRKPYGNWIAVKTSKSRKRTVATSH